MEKKQYKHLDQTKRDRLQLLRKSGHTQKEIAEVLGIDQSAISRELKRNCRKIRTKRGIRNGPYESNVAQHKAYLKRKYAKYQWKKINEDDNLKKYITSKLKLYWSPDQISGRMKKDKQPFYASKTAIYEWLYSDRGQYYCRYLYAGRFRPRKRRKKKVKKAMIPNRISIRLRPETINQRIEYGHYENDTMVSGKKTGSKAALSAMAERKAQYLDLKKIKNLRPKSNKEAILEMKEDKVVKSMTFDNGIENRKHDELGVDTYFCDPYSSWQKPGIENLLRFVRWFIPKGSDINDYSDEYIYMVTCILNSKPRKSLGYKTPYEVMIENNLFKNVNQKYALGG